MNEIGESSVSNRPQIGDDAFHRVLEELAVECRVDSLENMVKEYTLLEEQINKILDWLDNTEKLSTEECFNLLKFIVEHQDLSKDLIETMIYRAKSYEPEPRFNLLKVIVEKQELAPYMVIIILDWMKDTEDLSAKECFNLLKVIIKKQNLLSDLIDKILFLIDKILSLTEEWDDKNYFDLMKDFISAEYLLPEKVIDLIISRAKNLDRKYGLELMKFIAQNQSLSIDQINMIVNFVVEIRNGYEQYFSGLKSLINVIVEKYKSELTSDQILRIMTSYKEFADEDYFDLMDFISICDNFDEEHIKIVVDCTGNLARVNNLGINLMTVIANKWKLSIEQIFSIIDRADNIVGNEDKKYNLEDKKYNLMEVIAQNQNLSTKEINKIIETGVQDFPFNKYANLIKAVAKYKQLTLEQFTKIIDSAKKHFDIPKGPELMEAMAQNKNLSTEQIDRIIDCSGNGLDQDRSISLLTVIVQNQNLSTKQIEGIINRADNCFYDNYINLMTAIAQNKNLSTEQIDRVIDYAKEYFSRSHEEGFSLMMVIVQNQNLSLDNIHNIGRFIMNYKKSLTDSDCLGIINKLCNDILSNLGNNLVNLACALSYFLLVDEHVFVFDNFCDKIKSHIEQNELNNEQAKQIYGFFGRIKDRSYISKLNKIDGFNKLIDENKTTTLKLSTNLSYEQESILGGIKSGGQNKGGSVPSQLQGEKFSSFMKNDK